MKLEKKLFKLVIKFLDFIFSLSLRLDFFIHERNISLKFEIYIVIPKSILNTMSRL